MTCTWTTPTQDEVIDKCMEFGGLAAECAVIAGLLDDEISRLKKQIEGLNGEIESIESVIEREGVIS